MSRLICFALVVLIIQHAPLQIIARECTNVDIRNGVSSFDDLKGCSVVKGFLLIVLIRDNLTQDDYKNITFPELREITDFVLMYDVNGLANIQNMFPNLVVIRGRRLFQSYALAVSGLPDLQMIEFGSLIAIQRGHVYIGNCPKLCFLKKINWDRLTLTSGENHIFPADTSDCNYAYCLGCDYCWSYRMCQKFENSNLLNLARGINECHQQCLGGCFNSSNTGCNVCKEVTDHGACVSICPSNMYYSEHHQRCYTKEECYKLRFYVLGNECNRVCPSGYTRSRRLGQCIKCKTGCITECYPDEGYPDITISSLSDAEYIRDCEYIKGNLLIQLGAKVEEKDLVASLKNLRKVEGYIKVYYSPFLKSLQFLQSLEKIEGSPLENDTFALVIYNNQNLQELWTTPPGKIVEFVNGGIYSFANNKLCNKILQDFARNVIHSKDKDLLQVNDQEVLCEPVRLNVYENVITQNSVQISWPKNKTADEVEIIYREAKFSAGEESELDDDICMRVHWIRDLMFKTDLNEINSTHYYYNITNLLPYNTYEYLVKTFEERDDYAARSPLQRFLTKPDLPTAPKLITYAKSFENITFKWIPRNKYKEVVRYFILETFEQSIDLETLDTRNYCKSPVVHYANPPMEDYDECCHRKLDELEDEEFKRDLEDSFPCTVHSITNCHPLAENESRTKISVIDAKFKNYTVSELKHFTLYTFFLYACNDLGCGNYFMYSDRTLPRKGVDKVTKAFGCKNMTTLDYFVAFDAPSNPNGAVLNYFIHFDDKKTIDVPTENYGYGHCLSRKEFESHGNKLNIHFDDNFMPNQFAVRVATTAGSELSNWYEIGVCSQPKAKTNSGKMVIVVIVVFSSILLVWVSYRRRWWSLERFRAWRLGTQRFRNAFAMEDRQVLVDTVEFRNSVSEDL